MTLCRDLTSSSSVATRKNPNKFGLLSLLRQLAIQTSLIALAANNVIMVTHWRGFPPRSV